MSNPVTVLVGGLSGAGLWTLARGFSALSSGGVYGTCLGLLVVSGDWLGRQLRPSPAYETEKVLKVVKIALTILLSVGSLFLFSSGSVSFALRSILPLRMKSQILWGAIACLLAFIRHVVDGISRALEG